MSEAHSVARRDAAGNSTLSLGPMDVDGAAEVTARLGVHNKATQLLKRHAQMFPPALRTQLARPIDGDRSAFVQNDPDLVEAVRQAALDVPGRRRFLEEDDVVEGVNVKGDDLSGRIFGLIYRTASGRSARGVIAYESVPAAERAFQKAIAQPAQTHSGGGEGSGVPTGDAAELETALREAEEARQRAEQEAESLREAVAASANPEPFEGYDDLTADDIGKRVRSGGYKEFGISGLQRIEEYEQSQSKPRKGVLEAVSSALDDVPPDEAPEE